MPGSSPNRVSVINLLVQACPKNARRDSGLQRQHAERVTTSMKLSIQVFPQYAHALLGLAAAADGHRECTNRRNVNCAPHLVGDKKMMIGHMCKCAEGTWVRDNCLAPLRAISEKRGSVEQESDEQHSAGCKLSHTQCQSLSFCEKYTLINLCKQPQVQGVFSKPDIGESCGRGRRSCTSRPIIMHGAGALHFDDQTQVASSLLQTLAMYRKSGPNQ